MQRLIELMYRYRLLLLTIYGLTVVVLYLIPASGLNLNSWFIFGIRKDHFFHALMFLPLATLLVSRNATMLALAAILIAPVVEFIHALVPWRSFSAWDMVANATGAAIGFCFRAILLSVTKTNQEEKLTTG